MSTGTQAKQPRRTANQDRPSPRKVFISAPASTDTSVLRRLLEEFGFVTVQADEIDLVGQPLSAIVERGIAESDLAVAVIDGSTRSNNVFFELGLARAL